MRKDNVAFDDFIGTWSVIDETTYKGKKYYLWEHDRYGDTTTALITDRKYNIILDDVWNGFLDLYEYLD